MNLIRRIRLVSGLIMFAFVVSHLLNHALGLVSLELAENALWYLYRVYTSYLGSIALYGAFLTHFLLALYALWQRQSLRLRPWYERAQPYLYAAALLVPVLALLGVLVAGKEVMALAQNPDWVTETFTIHHRPPPEGLAVMGHLILV